MNEREVRRMYQIPESYTLDGWGNELVVFNSACHSQSIAVDLAVGLAEIMWMADDGWNVNSGDWPPNPYTLHQLDERGECVKAE